MGKNRLWPIAGGTTSQENVLFNPLTFGSTLFGFCYKCSKTILILIHFMLQGFYIFTIILLEIF